MQAVRSQITGSLNTRKLLAVSLATLMLCGCACDEQDWEAIVVSEAEASESASNPDCESANLARVSKASADLVGRADPQTLELARVEAERDCYKAAVQRPHESLK